MQTIIDRLAAPTPSFFKTLRMIGLVLSAVSGTLIAAPVALPAIVTTIAGYMAVGGSVAAVVSQLTIDPGVLPSTADVTRLTMTAVGGNRLSVNP